MIRYVKKDLVIGIGVGVPVLILMIVIGVDGHSDFGFENENEYGKINMNPKLSQCEILTNQMIQARNNMKQYVLNPNQFSSEESEKINNEYQNELNRISKEFSLKECDKNVDDWITPEITQRVIDQTGSQLILRGKKKHLNVKFLRGYVVSISVKEKKIHLKNGSHGIIEKLTEGKIKKFVIFFNLKHFLFQN